MDLTGARWRKSSYSSANGGACVEVAARWRKSSYSTGNGGECVEVAAGWHTSARSSGNGGECVEVAGEWHSSSRSTANGGECVQVARPESASVAVRDSKDPDGPVLAFTAADWTAFTRQVKAGQLR